MTSVAGRGDLTDRQWERLRRWVPAPSPKGRPITRSRRVLLNGVAWRVRVGSPWRDVPERYGPWPTRPTPHAPTAPTCEGAASRR